MNTLEAVEWKFEREFARRLDQEDLLSFYRNQFYFPQYKGEKVLYFTGNSLGLQPVMARTALERELEDWARWGVEGHMKATYPWYSYHEMFKEALAYLTGAKRDEVTAMGSLTANLHFLMASFYRPAGRRTKILYEHKAFPSDIYAIESQILFHGLDPSENMIEVTPDKGQCISTDRIVSTIKENARELALVLLGGVNYYTGQRFDMMKIADAAKKAGAFIGFDLAHAIGNVELELHDWEVDFAVWCSYKYLNSGPGSVAGIFVHEKHADNSQLPRLAGWWGYPADRRFRMENKFVPAYGADGWQLSNAPVFSMAVHRVALDMFLEATLPRLFEKRDRLTGYLEYVLTTLQQRYPSLQFQLITPADRMERGSQLSLFMQKKGKELFEFLSAHGVIADWREPDVIRLAPVPMYNSFEDVYRLGKLIEKYATQI